MNSRLSRLLEKLSSEEQAEVGTFAMFVIARRNLQTLQMLTDDVSTEELTKLVMDSGSFDWLDSPEEDVYSIEDGKAMQWPSILEIRGLEKEIWQDIDGQEHVDHERDSWHE
jgi:hypothetical protein